MRCASAIWVGLDLNEDEESHSKTVKYVYDLPEKGGNIDLELQQDQIYKLWTSIHDERENIATVIEIDIFHAALRKHIIRVAGLNLEVLNIKEVSLPATKIDVTGKVGLL